MKEKAAKIANLARPATDTLARGPTSLEILMSTASRDGMRHELELLLLSELKPAKRNARTHPKSQIRRLAQSMSQFGFITPIVVDSSGRIVAGHGRAAAAELLKLKRVPCIRVTSLSETELRAYALADNRIAEGARWDKELLALEIGELQVALPEIDLDIELTGFNPGEIDMLLADLSDDPRSFSDDIPEVQASATSRPGDLFVLDRHRIYVGDARNNKAYEELMGSQVATMAFLDPPYNVSVQGHVGGRGRTKHREFVFASGEMTSSQFARFLKDSLMSCAAWLMDGSIAYVCMDWRHAGELLEAGVVAFDELKNICVWTKTNPGQGAFYRNQYELIFAYKKGSASHINTFELGQHGRSRSNVWVYAGVNSFRAGRMDELKMHPTVKPVALIADAMRDCSRRGSIILDSFCGSGSTIIAAEQTGRRTFGIEIDPQYVDVAIRRWQALTGKDAILESTGQTFEEASQERAGEGTDR